MGGFLGGRGEVRGNFGRSNNNGTSDTSDDKVNKLSTDRANERVSVCANKRASCDRGEHASLGAKF